MRIWVCLWLIKIGCKLVQKVSYDFIFLFFILFQSKILSFKTEQHLCHFSISSQLIVSLIASSGTLNEAVRCFNPFCEKWLSPPGVLLFTYKLMWCEVLLPFIRSLMNPKMITWFYKGCSVHIFCFRFRYLRFSFGRYRVPIRY